MYVMCAGKLIKILVYPYSFEAFEFCFYDIALSTAGIH